MQSARQKKTQRDRPRRCPSERRGFGMASKVWGAWVGPLWFGGHLGVSAAVLRRGNRVDVKCNVSFALAVMEAVSPGLPALIPSFAVYNKFLGPKALPRRGLPLQRQTPGAGLVLSHSLECKCRAIGETPGRGAPRRSAAGTGGFSRCHRENLRPPDRSPGGKSDLSALSRIIPTESRLPSPTSVDKQVLHVSLKKFILSRRPCRRYLTARPHFY